MIRSRSGGLALLGAALLALQAANVNAVGLNACSTINNAASSPPIASDTWMTATNCKGNCSSTQFSVVQGTKCWCTNYFAASTVDIRNCLNGCPGWPSEQCAGNGYFGYIANNALASAAVSNAAAAQGSTQRTSSSVQQSRTQVSTQVIQSSASPSNVPVTSVVFSVSPSPVTIPAPPSSSSSTTSVQPIVISMATDTTPATSIMPVTSTQLVTVSGAVVTQFITSTPTAPATMASSAGENNTLPKPSTRHGLSGGAIAGIAVGAAIGGIIAAALLFFCCYRRRGSDEEGGMRRQPSLLSKAGLLRGDSTAMSPSKRRGPPALQTTGLGTFSGPASAASNAAPLAMTESRSSRPMITDSRLNPNAIMTHQNTSRSSVGTLQDNQDYSRPLEVRNPDP